MTADLRLVVRVLGEPSRLVTLPAGKTAVIGRAEDAEVIILHRSISRCHARIVWDPAGPVLIDADSRNGVWLDNVRVDRVELAPGKRVRVGEVRLEVEGPSKPDGAPPSIIAGSLQDLLSNRDGPASSAIRLATSPGMSPAELRLQVLLQVSQTLSSPERMEVVLGRILELAFRILEIERAVVLLADAQGRMVPQVSHPPAPRPWWSSTVVEGVAATGKAALHADAVEDAQLQGAASVVRERIHGSMAVPLTGKGHVLGVLYADTRWTGVAFDERDLSFLQAFGQHAAAAIENSRLVEQLQREAALRGSMVRFFPPAIAARLLNGPIETVETEVTAMFCDISGYSERTAQMAPRDVIAMLNAFYPAVARIIFDAGGTLEKYAGDAVLAVWGAPWSSPDDAERALRAAFAIQRLAAARRADPARVGPPFELHIGLHSGLVAAGNIGSADFVQYCTIGDATNVAARICGAASPGEVLCSEATWGRLLVRPEADVREDVPLKGHPGRHRVFAVRPG